MTINVSLSTESISRAINELELVKENILEGLRQTVEILVKEGSMIAQSADGEMATVTGEMTGDTTGTITASGRAAVIAEFGAGDAVVVPQFENAPDTPVYPGAYSLLEGTKEYYRYGSWHFGGVKYTEVQARQGLLKAKEYIQNSAVDVAMEVIRP